VQGLAATIVAQSELADDRLLVWKDKLSEHLRRDTYRLLRLGQPPQVGDAYRIADLPAGLGQFGGVADAARSDVIVLVVQREESFTFERGQQVEQVVAEEGHQAMQPGGGVVHGQHELLQADQVDGRPSQAGRPPVCAPDAHWQNVPKERFEHALPGQRPFAVHGEGAKVELIQTPVQVFDRWIPGVAAQLAFVVGTGEPGFNPVAADGDLPRALDPRLDDPVVAHVFIAKDEVTQPALDLSRPGFLAAERAKGDQLVEHAAGLGEDHRPLARNTESRGSMGP
jgi:hypothetical protein